MTIEGNFELPLKDVLKLRALGLFHTGVGVAKRNYVAGSESGS
jgi:hypothetical protein